MAIGTKTGNGQGNLSSGVSVPRDQQRGRWILAVAWTLAAGFWLTMMAMSWAKGAEREPASARDVASNDAAVGASDYNFQWLDPDKKIYVLQNRRYQKANRLQLSANAGLSSTNAYRDSYVVEPRLAFYFREWLGIEGFYSFFLNQENSTFQALSRAAPNALPNVRELRSQMGALLKFVPWYAKINVFNQILYFDWSFSGGAGQLVTALDLRTSSAAAANYRTENLIGYYLGTGHQYHLSDTFSIRLDYLVTFYRAPLFGTTGDATWFSSSNFSAGLGVRL